MSASILVRIGAAHHDVTITDKGQTTTFDLASMDRAAKSKFRRMLVGAWEAARGR